MAFDPFTLAGMLGTALMVAAYFATQQGRLTAKDWRYPLANLVGAILGLACHRVESSRSHHRKLLGRDQRLRTNHQSISAALKPHRKALLTRVVRRLVALSPRCHQEELAVE